MNIETTTIEQYKILEFINANLKIDSMKIILIDCTTVKLTNFKSIELIFKYDNEEITFEYQELCNKFIDKT
ncbi:hypothetical protein [Clostridium beijerinckii]|uniref:Uncharacterized protein n=1 Tax=Clostridium beijerinckii TaxID=1520 RepID=A0A9Q5GU85_CLOBE|nr:hypothetical protein [Clostridium beijerinckii]AQS04154.1 hypothetical protein CLBIJ_15720 [Clostridium beijerinckii]MBA2883959.1 hypothetical protein [Clostridium beijerinckii]MBA2899143.1 hypothetical protein [Clostridium beijerinckii]MBA2908545.1 hypothetical protein [Clostridium beijerinckii]MBA9016297.1 hypothetical protein [Clostridium beijerinckii]